MFELLASETRSTIGKGWERDRAVGAAHSKAHLRTRKGASTLGGRLRGGQGQRRFGVGSRVLDHMGL